MRVRISTCTHTQKRVILITIQKVRKPQNNKSSRTMNILLPSIPLLLLLIFTLHVRPITAHIELCRCAAHFELFYDVSSSHSDDTTTTTTMESFQYPYNYEDHYIDTEGYVIVEGIRVLSDRSTACAHENNRDYVNDDDDDDDDDDDAGNERRGRYLMMGSNGFESNHAAKRRIFDSMSPRRRRTLMGMMMGGSETVRYTGVVMFLLDNAMRYSQSILNTLYRVPN